MFERVQSARLGLAMLAGCAALLGGCDNRNGNVTCSGTGCPAVSGQYLFTLSEPVHCAAWQVGTAGSSYLNVQNNNGVLSVTLFSTETHPHFLAGSLFSGGAVSVSETQQLQTLGLPIASLTGAFSPAQGSGPPFRFIGTLTLTPTAAPPTTAGAPAATGLPAAGTPVPSSAPAAGTPVAGLTPVAGTAAPTAAPAVGAGAEDTSGCSGTVSLNAEQVTIANASTPQAATTTTTTGSPGTTGATGATTTGASGLR